MNETWFRRPVARAVLVALVVVSAWVISAGPTGAATAIFDPEPLPVLGSSGWSIPLVGNFAGSAFDDIFGYAPGSAADRLVVSAGDRNATSVGQSVTGNYDALIGDFAGDSHDDIFWYASNAPRQFPDSIWISKGDGTWVKRSVNILGEYRAFVGDFDGDAHDDIFWYAPGNLPDSIWGFTATGGHTSRSQPVFGFYEPVVGDFNDWTDGNIGDDIVWQNPSGRNPYWTATDVGFEMGSLDFPMTGVVVAGDFGSDDHDDLLINNAGTSTDRVVLLPFVSSQPIVVRGTYNPVVGDWNGDDHDDVLWDDVLDGPDPVWFGLGDVMFDKVGQVDLEPVSSVHRVQVGDIADAGGADDALVFAGSEGSPINSFQLYYGIPADT